MKMGWRKTAKRWLARVQALWIVGLNRRAVLPEDISRLASLVGPKILVIAYPPGLGDTLMVTPFLSALTANFNQPELWVLAGGPTSEVLARHPAVQGVIRYEDDWISKDNKRGPKKSSAERRALRNRLRRERFDAVFDLLGNFKSARLAASIRSPIRVGYSSGFEAFLTHPIPDHRFKEASRSMAEYHLELLREAELVAGHPEPFVSIGEEDDFADRCFCDFEFKGVWVGLVPAAADPRRTWDLKQFAKAADEIVQLVEGRGILLGAETERGVLDKVEGLMCTNPVNFCGQANIFQTAALLRRCHLMVSVNTGLMHLGASVGVKIVALMFEGSPLWRPWGEGHQVLTGLADSSSPEALKVEEVVRAAKKILSDVRGM
jgi:heptosyltransferase-2